MKLYLIICMAAVLLPAGTAMAEVPEALKDLPEAAAEWENLTAQFMKAEVQLVQAKEALEKYDAAHPPLQTPPSPDEENESPRKPLIEAYCQAREKAEKLEHWSKTLVRRPGDWMIEESREKLKHLYLLNRWKNLNYLMGRGWRSLTKDRLRVEHGRKWLAESRQKAAENTDPDRNEEFAHLVKKAAKHLAWCEGQLKIHIRWAETSPISRRLLEQEMPPHIREYTRIYGAYRATGKEIVANGDKIEQLMKEIAAADMQTGNQEQDPAELTALKAEMNAKADSVQELKKLNAGLQNTCHKQREKAETLYKALRKQLHVPEREIPRKTTPPPEEIPPADTEDIF